MASMYSDQITEEMAAEDADNIETLKGHGGSRDVSQVNGYDPHARLGTETNFARDVGAAGASRSPESGGSATHDLINDLPVLQMDATPEMFSENAKPPKGTWRDPAWIINAAAKRVMTSQFGIGVNASQILYDTPERMSVVIVNTHATNPVYLCGNSAGTSATGFAVAAGASITLALSGELWAISPLGASISLIEFLQ